MNILRALDDPKVFAPFFRGSSWQVWRVFLAALFGLPLTSEQLAAYTKHTGRTTAPTKPLHEAWLVCGRRSGKSSSWRSLRCFSRASGTGGRCLALARSPPS